MSDRRAVVREIAWKEVLPWLLIFRTFAVAISPFVIALALAGAVIMPIGWRISSALFLHQAKLDENPRLTMVTRANEQWPGPPGPTEYHGLQANRARDRLIPDSCKMRRGGCNMSIIRCLTCDRSFDTEQSPAMPFCSERCRKLDLYKWYNEDHGIPLDPEDQADLRQQANHRQNSEDD